MEGGKNPVVDTFCLGKRILTFPVGSKLLLILLNESEFERSLYLGPMNEEDSSLVPASLQEKRVFSQRSSAGRLRDFCVSERGRSRKRNGWPGVRRREKTIKADRGAGEKEGKERDAECARHRLDARENTRRGEEVF